MRGYAKIPYIVCFKEVNPISDLEREETSLIEQGALGYFRLDMSLASMAEVIEVRHNGRYSRFCTILRAHLKITRLPLAETIR